MYKVVLVEVTGLEPPSLPSLVRAHCDFAQCLPRRSVAPLPKNLAPLRFSGARSMRATKLRYTSMDLANFLFTLYIEPINRPPKAFCTSAACLL